MPKVDLKKEPDCYSLLGAAKEAWAEMRTAVFYIQRNDGFPTTIPSTLVPALKEKAARLKAAIDAAEGGRRGKANPSIFRGRGFAKSRGRRDGRPDNG